MSSTVHRADLGMAWAVKDSWLAYIHRMPDGYVQLGDGAGVTSTGEFFFPLAAVDVAKDSLRVELRGQVHFTGHQGMLSVRVAAPVLEVASGHAVLSVRAAGHEQAVATVSLPRVTRDGDVVMWSDAPAQLTSEGAELFGGSYESGAAVAPLTVRLPAARAATP